LTLIQRTIVSYPKSPASFSRTMSLFTLRRSAQAALTRGGASVASRTFVSSARRDLARISVIGNLADSPELQTTSTGHDIIRYAVASNSGPRDNRITSWFKVTAFTEEGPRRDFLLNIPKGAMVYIEGDVTINTWQDETGKNRSYMRVLQRNIEVLRRPLTEASSHETSQTEAQADANPSQ